MIELLSLPVELFHSSLYSMGGTYSIGRSLSFLFFPSLSGTRVKLFKDWVKQLMNLLDCKKKDEFFLTPCAVSVC